MSDVPSTPHSILRNGIQQRYPEAQLDNHPQIDTRIAEFVVAEGLDSDTWSDDLGEMGDWVAL